MVIRRDDRVSTVLRHDESLIDVFVSVSPAFEKLRNPRMRKVMSRLVTVEQAARIAGVDADELVSRLNAGAGAGSEPLARARPGEPAGERPAALREIPAENIVEVDVREDLRAGREPFSRIMASRRDVPEGGALCVRAIFEPVPLYDVLGAQGLDHHTERLAEDDWRVWFYAVPGRAPAPPVAPAPAAVEQEDGATVLDVRGLEPPEPMLRTLAALEQLPAGGVLVQINVRVPEFLLPLLDERGFTYEIREQEPGLVRVFIRRAPGESATPREERTTDAQ
ncbi:MAG: DUF2249 domain-containing protein [Thermoleophilia bacterium]|nr:DUF2249 domain-containing protein [Thermoleophilia bacterium]